MYNPNSFSPARRPPGERRSRSNEARLAGVTALLAMLAPLAAGASTQVTDEREPPPAVSRTPPAKAKAAGVSSGGYRVQCWQHGRLLFEEAHVTLPPADGSRFTLKLTGYDGNGRPMYVAETVNATCVVRYDRTLFNPALPR